MITNYLFALSEPFLCNLVELLVDRVGGKLWKIFAISSSSLKTKSSLTTS